MRKMKGVLSVLLVVILMLSLTACVQNQDATTAPATVSVGTGTTEGMKIDLNDGWTIGFANCGPLSEDGYYYIDDNFLYFMDIENGNAVILCSKAACKHDKETDKKKLYACEAFFPVCTILFYSDGYIYYDKYEEENPNAIHLYRRNADGTEEKKVATLCEAFFSQTTSVEISAYIAADGLLYYSASIYELVQTEPGAFVDTRTEVLLMRLDLTNGKEQEILRLKNAYIYPLAARKDALIYHRLDALPQDEMLNMNFEKLDAMPALMQIWTESSGTATTIFEKTDEQCTMLGIYGGKAYYSGRNEYTGLYTYDFATGEHTTPDLPGFSGMINDDYWYAHGEANTTIYDFHTGKPVSGDFENWEIYFRRIGEQGFLAEFSLYAGKTEKGELIKAKEIYGYIPFAALEDGLQKEDILIMYEEEYSN